MIFCEQGDKSHYKVIIDLVYTDHKCVNRCVHYTKTEVTCTAVY